jgi:GAF domain-containing protein
MMHSLLLRDCEPDEGLDRITREAAILFEAPIVLINLLTTDHIIFKSAVGFKQADRLDRSGSFCATAIKQDKPFMVHDASIHPDFKDDELVTGELGVRSYIGKSLHAPDGTRIGTLCMLDTKVRSYSLLQRRAFGELAKSAEQQLHLLLDPSASLPRAGRMLDAIA